MDRSYKRKNYRSGWSQGGGGSNNWNSKKKFTHQLKPGMIGFLCTCNTREQDCVKESYNVLNEYADKLQESAKPEAEEEVDGAGDANIDIEDELKKEVSDLKSSRREWHRFNVVDTGVKNNIFVKTTLEDPVKLGYSIMNDIAETKKQKGRFLMRIVPVEVTCKAYLEDIKTAADSLFDKHFRCEPTTFAVVVNKRYNDNLLRDDVITALALLVTDKNREHKANLKEAKHTVLVEILKGICCISVLEDYKRLRHYNIAELAKPEEKPEGDQEQKVTDEAEAKEEKGEISEIEKNEENKDEPINDDVKKLKVDEESHTDIPT